nr:hypothetical protein [Tanacetum cinerariifolium]
MASFDYRLNPIYPIKECSSCGALYTTNYCCSNGSLGDKIICDLNKTPDLSQRPPQNRPKCGNPIDGQYCQGCALLRKELKEVWFTICEENGIFQGLLDTSKSSNDNTNVINAPQEPFVVKQDPELLAEERAANINTQPFQYSIVHQPPQEEISVEFLQEKRKQINYVQTFLRKFNRIYFYEMPKVLSLARETILEIEHAFEDKHCQPETILEIELAFEDKHCQPEDILELFLRLHNDVQNIHEELAMYINTPSWDCLTICYNDDDDEDCTIAMTPILSSKELDNSLSMGDEHLDTIQATESNEFIKSSVENHVLILSKSEGIPGNMCDVPFHENSSSLGISKDQFEDFSDSNDDSTSIDDDSFSIDDIEYVEASPLDSELISSEVIEIVILEVGGTDDDILLTIKDDILREKLFNINLLIANIEALKDNLRK